MFNETFENESNQELKNNLKLTIIKNLQEILHVKIKEQFTKQFILNALLYSELIVDNNLKPVNTFKINNNYYIDTKLGCDTFSFSLIESDTKTFSLDTTIQDIPNNHIYQKSIKNIINWEDVCEKLYKNIIEIYKKDNIELIEMNIMPDLLQILRDFHND